MLCYVTVYPNCIGSANIQWTRASQEKLISTAWHYPLDKSRDNTIEFDSTNPKDGDLQLSAGYQYPQHYCDPLYTNYVPAILKIIRYFFIFSES